MGRKPLYLTSASCALSASMALEAQQRHLALKKLEKQPGRPDRHAILAHEEAVREATLAKERLEADVEELMELDVYCLEPIQGLALIPFIQENQLAWFVYDLFEPDQLRFWRYHSDPLETRRPVEGLAGPISPQVVV